MEPNIFSKKWSIPCSASDLPKKESRALFTYTGHITNNATIEESSQHSCIRVRYTRHVYCIRKRKLEKIAEYRVLVEKIEKKLILHKYRFVDFQLNK